VTMHTGIRRCHGVVWRGAILRRKVVDCAELNDEDELVDV